MWIFSLWLSKKLDALRAKKTISTTFARKVGTLIACLIPMACFFALSYIGCERGVADMLMTLAVTAIGGMFSGFLSNHIDIAPNFAGTLMAITNTVATIPGIIVPIFVGKLTESDVSALIHPFGIYLLKVNIRMFTHILNTKLTNLFLND